MMFGKRAALQCKFYVTFKLNQNSLYFTLADYDEVHNHPCSLESASARRQPIYRNGYGGGKYQS
jgi:hypothetical protein